MKRNIKFIISYDGTDFSGFQIQPQGRTVQKEIEMALLQALGEEIRITGCSRTDSGVHARKYVLSFKTESSIPADRMMYPVNDKLEKDIRVLSSMEVDETFNARFSVKNKSYSYRLRNSRVELPIDYRYTATEKGKMDYRLIKECIPYFIGTHDFKAFMSTGSDVKDTVRTINSLKADFDENDKLYTFTINGDGFLYNMVRIIVGTLVYVSLGVLDKEDVIKAIEKGDRKSAGKVMPAKGLTLEEVFY